MLDGTKHSEEVLGGVFVIRPDEDLALAFLCLLRLLERPERIAIRAPLQIRELHALLLDSSCGNQLRTLASAGSAGHSVLQAVNWIRNNYASACSVEKLAERANMSPATFYRKFRQVTGSSLVQFRKKCGCLQLAGFCLLVKPMRLRRLIRWDTKAPLNSRETTKPPSAPLRSKTSNGLRANRKTQAAYRACRVSTIEKCNHFSVNAARRAHS